LKSGGAAVIGVVVVWGLTELDSIEDVAVTLEDVALEDAVTLEEMGVLEDVVVLTEDAVCAGLG